MLTCIDSVNCTFKQTSGCVRRAKVMSADDQYIMLVGEAMGRVCGSAALCSGGQLEQRGLRLVGVRVRV